MKATVTSAFNRTFKTTKSAFDKSMKRAGIETDPHVMLYNTLNTEDFDQLSKLYGEDTILNYIRKMESKRLFK